jgi:hypothetical protein
MNSDFRELLQALSANDVGFLVVGGYAVIHHTQPRYTKDLDIWIKPSVENARKLMSALHQFGIPLLGLTESDFAAPKTQLSVGVAPCAIDLLTTVPGLEFEAAWDRRVLSEEGDLLIPYLSKQDLVAAKTTAGRPQDLADLDELRRAE